MGLKSFIQGTIVQTAALSRLSTNLDMSALSLSQWQHAAVMAGGTAEDMTATLQKAQGMQAELSISGKVSEELLATQKYGAKYGFNINPNTSGEGLLKSQADIVKNLIRDTGMNNAHTIATKEMGMSEGIFNLLKDGSVALQKNLDAQKEVAEAEAKLAKSAEELRKETVALTNQFKALGISLMTDILPYLKDFGGYLKSEDFKASIKFFGDEVRWAGKIIAWVAQNIIKMIPGGEAALYAWKLLNPEYQNPNAAKLTPGAAARVGHEGKITPKGYVPVGGSYDSNSPVNVSKNSSIVGKLVAMGGWTPAQAAGIAGNLQHESGGFNPQASGDGGKAYGLAQWHPDRQAEFKNKYGKDIRGSSIDEQLAFVNYELTQGLEKPAGDKIRAAKTAEQAALATRQFYERANPAFAHDDTRIKNAQNLLSGYQSSNASSNSSLPMAFRPQPSSTSTNSNSSSSVNINNMNINTQATDAPGIAGSIGQSLNNTFQFGAPNANQGIS